MFCHDQVRRPHLQAPARRRDCQYRLRFRTGPSHEFQLRGRQEGIVALTRSLARELGRFGIRCNAVRPRAQTGMAAAFNERARKWIPLMDALGKFAIGFEMSDRFGPDYKPERVSALVVWLCTDAAANINGRTLYAGGDEVGLYSEPELKRTMARPGGWDLDSLDANRVRLAGDLTNDFLLKDSIGDKEL